VRDEAERDDALRDRRRVIAAIKAEVLGGLGARRWSRDRDRRDGLL
jgi:hypothetical protein